MKSDKNILVAFFLNISFSIFELIGGVITNSVAIISDAIHDFGDAISIGISYFLEKVSKRKPDNNYTYGYVRYSVLGALFTNIILIVGSILVIISSIKRLFNPVSINYDGMILFAIFGVIVNFLAVYFTKGGKSLNQKAVNLHMLEDVLGWILVLVGALVIKITKFVRIDACLSIIVAIFILVNALKGINKILNVFLEKIPDGVKVEEITKHLLKITGVKDVHHIHIWSMDGVNNYATMHIVTKEKDLDKLKKEIKEELKKHDINHVTVEIENSNETCAEVKCSIEANSNITHQHHHH